jgi:hypothetical protein
MARVRVTKTDGKVIEARITPAMEYGFEIWKGMGFAKAFSEEQKQTDVFYLAWLVCSRSPEWGTIKTFGAEFVNDLEKVEIVDDEAPNV